MCEADRGNALESFRQKVLELGSMYYRDLPWRHTRDPYEIWISEVMLQQTQVSRIEGRWERWLERFPTVDSLAAATTADVLEEWQGLGYNRRAIALTKAARIISENGGIMPKGERELISLPGIGPATASGIRAFAFNLPGVYLETNVRAVFLYEMFPNAVDVPDSRIAPLVSETCPKDDSDPTDDPRTWYYSLLDYGAYIKKNNPNPTRRSKTYTRQSRFEGSHRQKRAAVVRALLEMRSVGISSVSTELLEKLFSPTAITSTKGGHNVQIDRPELITVLEELETEGFCSQRDGFWTI